MNPLDPLAPDQRAVVSLVLQQGRSYDEIAALLGMPVDAVRARAQAGLAVLARDDGLPAEVTGPVADYLLGQQADADAEATRGLLAESESARAWAGDVAARLEAVAPGRLAEIPVAGDEPPLGTGIEEGDSSAPRPAETALGSGNESHGAAPEPAAPPGHGAPPGPRPRPVREPGAPEPDDAPPAASRLGGALLILGVLAVVALVLFLVLRGGDDSGDEATAGPTATAPATATATATPSAAPTEPAETIRLRPPGGGDATGTMSLYLQQGQLLFALEAQNVPPNSPNAAYAVWFTGPGAKARRLGFTNPVGEDGQLGIQGPSDKDLAAFPQLYATYERVVVSEETNENAKRPGKVILAGRLPQGR
jgi:hypothetical protein